MTYVKSVRASMYLSETGKSENLLGEQVAGANALPRAPQLDDGGACAAPLSRSIQ